MAKSRERQQINMVKTGKKCVVCGKDIEIAEHILQYIKWDEEFCSRECAEFYRRNSAVEMGGFSDGRS